MKLSLNDIEDVYKACGADPYCRLNETVDPQMSLADELVSDERYLKNYYQTDEKMVK